MIANYPSQLAAHMATAGGALSHLWQHDSATFGATIAGIGISEALVDAMIDLAILREQLQERHGYVFAEVAVASSTPFEILAGFKAPAPDAAAAHRARFAALLSQRADIDAQIAALERQVEATHAA
ncbi:MAG: hypothetical protein IT495_17085 [Gammaproteobacteria bacterium]|nr:hypothetical protein [Gammaproteobacteria bacterium]